MGALAYSNGCLFLADTGHSNFYLEELPELNELGIKLGGSVRINKKVICKRHINLETQGSAFFMNGFNVESAEHGNAVFSTRNLELAGNSYANAIKFCNLQRFTVNRKSSFLTNLLIAQGGIKTFIVRGDISSKISYLGDIDDISCDGTLDIGQGVLKANTIDNKGKLKATIIIPQKTWFNRSAGEVTVSDSLCATVTDYKDDGITSVYGLATINAERGRISNRFSARNARISFETTLSLPRASSIFIQDHLALHSGENLELYGDIISHNFDRDWLALEIAPALREKLRHLNKDGWFFTAKKDIVKRGNIRVNAANILYSAGGKYDGIRGTTRAGFFRNTITIISDSAKLADEMRSYHNMTLSVRKLAELMGTHQIEDLFILDAGQLDQHEGDQIRSRSIIGKVGNADLSGKIEIKKTMNLSATDSFRTEKNFQLEGGMAFIQAENADIGGQFKDISIHVETQKKIKLAKSLHLEVMSSYLKGEDIVHEAGSSLDVIEDNVEKAKSCIKLQKGSKVKAKNNFFEAGFKITNSGNIDSRKLYWADTRGYHLNLFGGRISATQAVIHADLICLNYLSELSARNTEINTMLNANILGRIRGIDSLSVNALVANITGPGGVFQSSHCTIRSSFSVSFFGLYPMDRPDLVGYTDYRSLVNTAFIIGPMVCPAGTPLAIMRGAQLAWDLYGIGNTIYNLVTAESKDDAENYWRFSRIAKKTGDVVGLGLQAYTVHQGVTKFYNDYKPVESPELPKVFEEYLTNHPLSDDAKPQIETLPAQTEYYPSTYIYQLLNFAKDNAHNYLGGHLHVTGIYGFDHGFNLTGQITRKIIWNHESGWNAVLTKNVFCVFGSDLSSTIAYHDMAYALSDFTIGGKKYTYTRYTVEAGGKVLVKEDSGISAKIVTIKAGKSMKVEKGAHAGGEQLTFESKDDMAFAGTADATEKVEINSTEGSSVLENEAIAKGKKVSIKANKKAHVQAGVLIDGESVECEGDEESLVEGILKSEKAAVVYSKDGRAEISEEAQVSAEHIVVLGKEAILNGTAVGHMVTLIGQTEPVMGDKISAAEIMSFSMENQSIISKSTDINPGQVFDSIRSKDNSDSPAPSENIDEEDAKEVDVTKVKTPADIGNSSINDTIMPYKITCALGVNTSSFEEKVAKVAGKQVTVLSLGENMLTSKHPNDHRKQNGKKDTKRGTGKGKKKGSASSSGKKKVNEISQNEKKKEDEITNSEQIKIPEEQAPIPEKSNDEIIKDKDPTRLENLAEETHFDGDRLAIINPQLRNDQDFVDLYTRTGIYASLSEYDNIAILISQPTNFVAPDSYEAPSRRDMYNSLIKKKHQQERLYKKDVDALEQQYKHHHNTNYKKLLGGLESKYKRDIRSINKTLINVLLGQTRAPNSTLLCDYDTFMLVSPQITIAPRLNVLSLGDLFLYSMNKKFVIGAGSTVGSSTFTYINAPAGIEWNHKKTLKYGEDKPNKGVIKDVQYEGSTFLGGSGKPYLYMDPATGETSIRNVGLILETEDIAAGVGGNFVTTGGDIRILARRGFKNNGDSQLYQSDFTEDSNALRDKIKRYYETKFFVGAVSTPGKFIVLCEEGGCKIVGGILEVGQGATIITKKASRFLDMVGKRGHVTTRDGFVPFLDSEDVTIKELSSTVSIFNPGQSDVIIWAIDSEGDKSDDVYFTGQYQGDQGSRLNMKGHKLHLTRRKLNNTSTSRGAKASHDYSLITQRNTLQTLQAIKDIAHELTQENYRNALLTGVSPSVTFKMNWGSSKSKWQTLGDGNILTSFMTLNFDEVHQNNGFDVLVTQDADINVDKFYQHGAELRSSTKSTSFGLFVALTGKGPSFGATFSHASSKFKHWVNASFIVKGKTDGHIGKLYQDAADFSVGNTDNFTIDERKRIVREDHSETQNVGITAGLGSLTVNYGQSKDDNGFNVGVGTAHSGVENVSLGVSKDGNSIGISLNLPPEDNNVSRLFSDIGTLSINGNTIPIITGVDPQAWNEFLTDLSQLGGKIKNFREKLDALSISDPTTEERGMLISPSSDTSSLENESFSKSKTSDLQTHDSDIEDVVDIEPIYLIQEENKKMYEFISNILDITRANQKRNSFIEHNSSCLPEDFSNESISTSPPIQEPRELPETAVASIEKDHFARISRVVDPEIWMDFPEILALKETGEWNKMSTFQKTEFEGLLIDQLMNRAKLRAYSDICSTLWEAAKSVGKSLKDGYIDNMREEIAPSYELTPEYKQAEADAVRSLFQRESYLTFAFIGAKAFNREFDALDTYYPTTMKGVRGTVNTLSDVGDGIGYSTATLIGAGAGGGILSLPGAAAGAASYGLLKAGWASVDAIAEQEIHRWIDESQFTQEGRQMIHVEFDKFKQNLGLISQIKGAIKKIHSPEGLPPYLFDSVQAGRTHLNF
ncbi:MAG: hypothetical protein ACH349_04140 [Candidatus Rhabdochlamydia sp.]